MNEILERLRGGLIVSVQANADSLLNDPQTIAVLARVAQANGALAVRIEGLERIRAVKAAVHVPVIGIIKRLHEGFEPYITTTRSEADQIAAAGADIIAFDATDRPRANGDTLTTLIEAIHGGARLAMADCATLRDGQRAAAGGADIVATTLAGYTPQTQGHALPALDLLAELRKIHPFAICEGGVANPADVRAALEAGAGAVVVGTAITNIDTQVRRFVAATRQDTKH